MLKFNHTSSIITVTESCQLWLSLSSVVTLSHQVRFQMHWYSKLLLKDTLKRVNCSYKTTFASQSNLHCCTVNNHLICFILENYFVIYWVKNVNNLMLTLTLLFFACSFVSCRYIYNTISINIKSNFNLWYTTRCWRNTNL